MILAFNKYITFNNMLALSFFFLLDWKYESALSTIWVVHVSNGNTLCLSMACFRQKVAVYRSDIFNSIAYNRATIALTATGL